MNVILKVLRDASAEELAWRKSVDDRLSSILSMLTGIQEKEDTIVKELDDLGTQVKANTDAEQSAIALINGIAARITAAGADPAALSALSTSLKTSADALAAAVVANTPAAG